MKVLGLIFVTLMAMLLLAKCNTLKLRLNSGEDICRLFPDGSVLRKPGSCQQTIKCINAKSTPHSVKCTDKKIVKLDKMTCGPDSIKSPDKYCSPVCKNTSPKYIEDIKNCNEWTECKGANNFKAGRCPSGQIFNQTQQSCIYDNGECERTYDICSVAKTNQRFWDENNCHQYFYCNSKKVLNVAKCPITNYYSPRTGECIKKAQVGCYKHPFPENGCGTKKLAVLNRFISDKATCRGYFYCKNLGKSKDGNFIPDESPSWGQCGVNEFFDEESQTCCYMNYITCDEDRCDSRNSGKILSEKPGCQHYLVCKDGYTSDEVKCPDNKYFDPIKEACVDTPIWYPICN